MYVELTKGEYVWFCKFLNKFLELKKTHVLNGMKVPDSIMKHVDDIISMEQIKGGSFLIKTNEKEAMFYAVLLEDCMFCCPGCSVSSVKHRSSIISKMCKLLKDEEESD